MDVESLKAKLSNFGQEHALQFWDSLSEEERKYLYNDISSINHAEVARYYEECTADIAQAGKKVDDQMQPVSPDVLGSVVRTDKETLKRLEQKGWFYFVLV